VRQLHIICMIMAAIACWSLPLAAQTPPSAPTVAEVSVEGNVHMSESAMMSYIRTRAGDFYDESVVQADVQRLLTTGRFESVDARLTDTPQGPSVTFVVVEKPVINRIEIRGNKAIKEGVLLKELPFATGSAFSPQSARLGRDALLNKYRQEGYYFAEVTLDEAALQRGEVIYEINEGHIVRTRHIDFRGNEHFADIRLRFSISSGVRIWPFTKGQLDDDKIEQDIQTIRTMYIDEGFLEAQVSAQKEFTEDKRNARLVFNIEEGPRFRVNQVSFVGNTVFSSDELAGRITLGQGEYYTALALRRDLERLQDTYGEIGFINASATSSRTFLDPSAQAPQWAADAKDPALLNVTFDIQEGQQYRVGQVLIRGNSVTYDRVIRRELRFHPEQLYNTVAVKESRRSLLESRLFEDVTIVPVGQEPGVRDALVNVREGQTAEFIIGAGISSRDGLVGNISFAQRNFDLFGWPKPGRTGPAMRGAGQTLRVTAEPGVELMRSTIDWYEPYIFDQPYSLGVRGFIVTRERESYDETRFGPVVSVGHTFKNRWYGELAGRLEGVDISDVDSNAPRDVRDVKGSNFLAGLKATIARNRTDSRWAPSTGDSLRLSYEQVTGDFDFGVATADYQVYYTVWMDALDRKHIVSLRGSAGNIFGDAPVFERFYGGGLGSVRGFKYRGISPRGGIDEDPIGGDFMLFAGAEYTFPLIAEVVRGVVFLDSGTVETDFGVNSYRVAAGFGLRWVIPFFGPIPMSLDFGFPLSKESEDDRQIVSFSLGWVF
jgi:outer membrane protein insertion porin family